ncbi:hypothetical protein B0H15DRAFT_799000 [Mycena belliarum]|uniref:Uncharacterized protein n=1 Tax=Mycena belliarum TaxID=1033014 RepID=A0AAD6UD19_9AGAR|nr:hypothetical protein B0H15DRAFT_799000 [Mycena belliae]
MATTSTLAVPTGFSYVVAALVSTLPLLAGQVLTVSRFRARAGIKYPNLYADKAEVAASPTAHRFNCMQRAHQNTIENIAMIYMTSTVLGLRHPMLAASALGAWIIATTAYTVGYASGDPARRDNIFTNIFYMPAIGTLFFGSIYSAYELVVAGI